VTEKKFYWLKLDRNFFKRHDIRIIEDMPNGKEYVLFYMKLLLESIDHEGMLRFNDLVPYNDQMLATITNTNIDIVRSAIKMFQQLSLMEILDDQTIFITDTNKMLGESTSTHRVQRFRVNQKIFSLVQNETQRNVTETLHGTELEKELEIDKEKDKEYVGKRFTIPTLDDVKSYCLERKNKVDAEMFIDFYTSKNWLVGKSKMKDWKASVRTWEKSNGNRKQNDRVDVQPNFDESHATVSEEEKQKMKERIKALR